MAAETSILGSLLKSVGKGIKKYGEKTLDDATVLGSGLLSKTSKLGETVIDSATKEGGKLNTVAKKLFEEIPEAEREGLTNDILPYRMKKHKTQLEKNEKGRVIVDGHETSAVGSAMWKGSTWLKDNVIKSPGGQIALGITGVGFGIGVMEGGNANKLGYVEGEKIANMVSDESSPLIKDVHAVENAEIHGIDTYGADGNIVFALHNMR